MVMTLQNILTRNNIFWQMLLIIGSATLRKWTITNTGILVKLINLIIIF